MQVIQLVFAFGLFITQCWGLKILGIMPLNSRSHYFPFQTLMDGLARKGHEVTFISPFPYKNPPKTLSPYTVGEKVDMIRTEMLSFDDIGKSFGGESPEDFSFKLFGVYIFQKLTDITCRQFFETDEMKTFRDRKQHFDVVIVEAFHTDCWFPFAAFYGAQLVHFTAAIPMAWYNDRFGQPSNPSYLSNMMAGFPIEMNFYERLQNVIIDNFHKYYFDNIQEPANDEAARQFFGPGIPDRDTIAKSARLLLINTHFSFSGPRPYVPGLVEVGGLHAIKEVKKLPQVYNKSYQNKQNYF